MSAPRGADPPPMTPAPSSLVQVGIDIDGQLSLLDVVPDAIVAADSMGKIVLCNHRAATIFGTSLDDLVGRPVEELIPSERRERHKSLRTEFGRHPVGRPMHSISAVEGLRLDDGSKFPVRVSLSPTSVHGEPHVVATIRDVSEERPGGVASHVMRDAPRYLADSSIDLVAVLDEGEACTWVSLSIERLAGVAPEAVLGSRLDGVIHADDAPAWAAALDQARATRPTVTADLRLCDPDNPDRCRWLAGMVTSRVDSDGRVTGFVVGFRDVHALVLADQARARSDRMFRVAMYRSPVGMAQVSPKGTILAANEALGRLLLRDTSGIVGTRFAGLAAGSPSKPDLDEVLDRCLQQHPRAATAEMELPRQDEGPAWVRLEASLVRTPEGHTDHFIVQFVDLTDAREAAAALALSEHRYRLLAQNSTDVVVEMDASRAITWASPSVAYAVGLSPREVEGRPVSELAIWEDRRDFESHVFDALASRRVGTWQCRIRTGPNDWRWMSARCAPTNDGEDAGEQYPVAVVGLSDVHDLVMARESTARSERMFRLAMDGAPQGMAVVGLHNFFLEANDALARTVGRPIEWLLEHTLADVLHPSDLEADLALRDELLVGRRETTCAERRLVGGDGRTIRVTHSTSLLRDETGMPLYFVEHFQDITDLDAKPAL